MWRSHSSTQMIDPIRDEEHIKNLKFHVHVYPLASSHLFARCLLLSLAYDARHTIMSIDRPLFWQFNVFALQGMPFLDLTLIPIKLQKVRNN